MLHFQRNFLVDLFILFHKQHAVTDENFTSKKIKTKMSVLSNIFHRNEKVFQQSRLDLYCLSSIHGAESKLCICTCQDDLYGFAESFLQIAFLIRGF